MTVQDIKQAIAQHSVLGCFLFYGEEEYLKRYYRDETIKCLLGEGGLAELNHTVFDGTDITMPQLLDAVKAMPMMADIRLVEWRHADIESMKAKEFEELLHICSEVKEQYTYTVLLITATAEGIDAGTAKRMGDRLVKMTEAMETVLFPHSTDSQLMSWIHRHFVHEKLSDSAEVCRLLLLRCGHDMADLANEIQKVVCYVKMAKRDTVTPNDVTFVTSVNRENDTYALSNALLEGNLPLAFSCFEELKSRRVDPAIVAGQLFRVYSDLASVALFTEEGKSTDDIAKALKMNGYKTGLYVKAVRRMTVAGVCNALKACEQTDLYYKSVYVNAYDQLEKLLIRISRK